jgi:hypothetical protein
MEDDFSLKLRAALIPAGMLTALIGLFYLFNVFSTLSGVAL